MKRFFKIGALIIALCQILLCFAACKKDGEVVDSTSEEAAFELTAENLAEYNIITSGSGMTSVATKLATMIEKVTGKKPEVKTDKIIEGSDTYCESEYEIIIGNANRDEAKEFYPSHA